MSIASLDAPIRFNLIEGAAAWLHRVPLGVRAFALAGLMMAGGYQVSLALQTPGQLIRGQLEAAGAETAALPWNRSRDQVVAAVARHFAGRDVRIDATKFPVLVAVTLPDIDRNTCEEAHNIARRIEGSVVVALASTAPCGDSNAMVWRIMP
ncbi:MAG TPA: hypothetical protein VGU20_17465 [Stellaceae bacterium]|nr:hypothetical protein [Stellaceae bacterium]